MRIDQLTSLLDLEPGNSIEDVEARIARLPANEFREAEAFLLRIPKTAKVSAFADPDSNALENLLRRVSGKPILLVQLNQHNELGVWHLTDRGEIRLDEREEKLAVQGIRRTLVNTSLRTGARGTLLRSSNNYHFVTPSLKHTNIFLRVANAINSKANLDRLALSLAPDLGRCDAVLIDTWNITSIFLRSLQMIGREMPFECLTSHPVTFPDEARELLFGLLREVEEGGKVLFLSSAIGTGTAVSTLQALLEEDDRNITFDWLALFGFSDSPDKGRVISRLEQAQQCFTSTEECELCKNGSRPIRVDPSLYYIVEDQEEEVALRPKFWKSGRQFIEGYGDLRSALQLHRDDPNDDTHHAFFIDMLGLLEDREFSEAFLEGVDAACAAGSPDLVVAPPHPAGLAMARMASEKLRAKTVFSNSLRRTTLTKEECELLDGSRHLLIIDDVIKSGSRLEEYTRSLREEFEQFSSVTYLVGVARPESEASLARIRIALTQGHSWASSLQWLEKFVLPLWDSTCCPWCAEYDSLSDIAASYATPPAWLRDRILHLSQMKLGLSETPFLLPETTSDRTLGRESAIGPAGLPSIGTVFSFASGLQQMRSSPKETERLSLGFPLSNVFAIKNFKNYSEALLRACILRLIRPGEWPSDVQGKQVDLLADVKKDIDFLLGEYLLAMARRSLKPLVDEPRLYDLWHETFALKREDLLHLLGLP